ncbi:MAG: DUF4215 domain-containing protein, partial [Planctomycetota bacterium]
DGNTEDVDGCSVYCQVEQGFACSGSPSVCEAPCGDGVFGNNPQEACDDGNYIDGDGCTRGCQLEDGWTCTQPSGATSVCEGICGDGQLLGGEACDDGDTDDGDGCSGACAVEDGWLCGGDGCVAICGDGLRLGRETCDDGNTTAGDGCSSACTLELGWQCPDDADGCTAVCGDGLVRGDEQCDDSNLDWDDGCDAYCQVEGGWSCAGEPSSCGTCGDGQVDGAEECDDGDLDDGDGCDASCEVEASYYCGGSPSVCSVTCGNSVLGDAGEECDDGDLDDGDGCSHRCTIEPGWSCTGAAGGASTCDTTCGDGVPAGAEQCDDGDTDANDGCDAACDIEHGYTCTGAPSVCVTTCGDGLIADSEACDDDNTSPGDGCDALCRLETGFNCSGEPTSCDSVCGDGLVRGAEECDDGDTDDLDGCDGACEREPGYGCAGEPSVCQSCGNGSEEGTEECDDGNNDDGDGCSSTCSIEACASEPGGCDVPDAGPDGGQSDAGEVDAGQADAGQADAGPSDAGDIDAGADGGAIFLDAGGSPDAGDVDGGDIDGGDFDGGPAKCANDIAEGDEVCDGKDLRGETCLSQGYMQRAGTGLECNLGCDGFVFTQCLGGQIVDSATLEGAIIEAGLTPEHDIIGLVGGTYVMDAAVAIDECTGSCSGTEPGMTLQPVGDDQVIIDGSGISNRAIFDVGSPNVRITGLTFVASASAIQLSTADYGEVDHNAFIYTAVTPTKVVDVKASLRPHIHSNLIDNSSGNSGSSGIDVADSPGSRVEMNAIWGEFSRAIRMQQVSPAPEPAYLDHNTIHAPVGTGIGVELFEHEDLCARGNVLANLSLAWSLTRSPVTLASNCTGPNSQDNVVFNAASQCFGGDCDIVCDGGLPLCELTFDPGLDTGVLAPRMCVDPGGNAFDAAQASVVDMVDGDPLDYLDSAPELGAREAGATRVYGGTPSTCPAP